MGDFEVPPLEHSPWPTPSRAIYGFVLYVVSYLLFGFYLLWALLPDSWLREIGLTYLPARHWVITFPYLLVFGFIATVIGYYLRYLWLMPNLEEIARKDCDSDRVWSGKNDLQNELTDLDNPVEIDKSFHEKKRILEKKRLISKKTKTK